MSRSATISKFRAVVFACLSLTFTAYMVNGCGGSDDGGGGGGGNGGAGGNGGGGGNGGSGGSGGSGGNGGSGGSGGGGTPITSNGCAGGTCLNPDCMAMGTAAAVGAFAELEFTPKPAYIPTDVIIPTFDDVPDGVNDPKDPVYGDGGWTTKSLEFFKTNGMHVDMFMNTDNWCGPVAEDDDCKQAVIDILKDHNPANHTIHHIHIGIPSPAPDDPGCADDAACEAELSGVEAIMKTLSNGGIPHLTRFRAPYGEPFQVKGTGIAMAQGVVKRHAVHIGWNLDSGDSTCNSTTMPCFTGDMIAQNVINLVGTAPGSGTAYGVLLQHATYPWTYDALPKLYGKDGYFAKHGFRIGTVEDAICWKYGKHSWEIVKEMSGNDFGPN